MNKLKNAAESFALNHWLSDYPEDWEYQKIIDCLNDNCRSWGRFVFAEDKNSDDPLSVDPWEVVEDYSGHNIANFIEDTRRSFESYVNAIYEA